VDQPGREAFSGAQNGGCFVEIVEVAEVPIRKADVPGNEVGGERVKNGGEEVPANARQNVQES